MEACMEGITGTNQDHRNQPEASKNCNSIWVHKLPSYKEKAKFPHLTTLLPDSAHLIQGRELQIVGWSITIVTYISWLLMYKV